MSFTSKNPYYIPIGDRFCENLYYRMHELYQSGWIRSARFLKFLMWRLFHTFIPPQAKIGKRLVLPHHGFGIVMHEDTIIGNDAIIFHNNTFGNGSIRIGNCLYMGTGAVIIGPVKIGDYVSIAANSYVNFDIPSYGVVIGNPGQIKKIRSKKEIEEIRNQRIQQ